MIFFYVYVRFVLRVAILPKMCICFALCISIKRSHFTMCLRYEVSLFVCVKLVVASSYSVRTQNEHTRHAFNFYSKQHIYKCDTNFSIKQNLNAHPKSLRTKKKKGRTNEEEKSAWEKKNISEYETIRN